MSQYEPSPEVLAFIRALFGVDAVIEVETFDVQLCDDPGCVFCVEQRKRLMAERNRRIARSSPN